MSVPFLKKQKDGFSVDLHQALYPGSAIDAFKKVEPAVVVGRKGPYWSLRFCGAGEAQALAALDQLLLLSKGQRAK